MIQRILLLSTLILFFIDNVSIQGQEYDLVPMHIQSRDVEIIDEAFLHGYTHNMVVEFVKDIKIPTLTIQCTDESVHKSDKDLKLHRQFFSVWTKHNSLSLSLLCKLPTS